MTEEIIEGFELSPQQKHVWSLLNDSPSSYYVQATVLIEGSLDLTRLQNAWATIVARHEILRTTFQRVPGMHLPVQVIADQVHTDISILDKPSSWAVAPQSTQDEQLQQVRHRASQSLTYDQTPTVLTLVTLAPQRAILLLTLSALLADTETLTCLVEEMHHLYSANTEDDAERIQYVDLADWQNELLTSEETEDGRFYWQQRNLTTWQTLPLPFQREADSTTPSAPQAYHFTLPAFATAQLPIATERFLQACWQLWLWQSLEQPPVFTLGVMYDGRKYEELEGVPGLFARYLPFVTPIEAESVSFRDFLSQIETHYRELYDWQEYFNWASMETVENSFYSYGYDFTPLAPSYQGDTVTFTIQTQTAYIEPFQLRLSITERETVFAATIYYNGRLLQATDVARIAAQWQTLVVHAAMQLDSPIAQLNMIGQTEMQQLLQQFNQTAYPFPKETFFHTQFEAQAKRTPHHTAVICGSQQQTYAQLDEQANRLAHALQAAGVGPESIVAIYLPRSIDMVASLLAILKAGGAYLPLDPTYPPKRLAFMLRDAHATHLLTHASFIDNHPLPKHNCQPILLDKAQALYSQTKPLPPSSKIVPQNLAYVIYTSGSTGEPKGVMVSHQNLMNYLYWCIEKYDLEAGMGTVVHSPLGFDLTITSLLPPLLVGQTVILVPETEGIKGLSTSLLHYHDVTLVKLTPSHLELLTQLLPAEAIHGRVRQFIIGGEALAQKTLHHWQQGDPQTRFINEYGPTETVVGCATYQLPPHLSSDFVPIGQPIANTQIYILDIFLQPRPIGLAGELYIGGVGVSRGYLNRPAVTATRFVPNPFSRQAGTRLYKTGDIARYQPDGTLEFLGRTDHQVKIHGYRIELGEIEAELVAHPIIQDAVVLAHEDSANRKQLVAYLVSGHPLESQALRAYLKQTLPDYMVPTRFMPLETFPLTANGKIDRDSLPAPQQDTKYIAPRTQQEEILATIWQQVLEQERVGIDENYFALGGDSIRSIQVVVLAQARGVDISMDQLFAYPTIRTLLQNLHEHTDITTDITQLQPFSLISEADLARIPVGVEDAYPVAMLQAGMIFHSEYGGEMGMYHDIFSYHIKMSLDAEKINTAVTQVIQHHPTLRTTFDLINYSEPLQLVHEKGADVLHIEDWCHLSEAEQDAALNRWLQSERKRGFDVTQLPLFRMYIHRRSQQTVQFSFSFHHAILDGWSDYSLLVELLTLYQSHLQGNPIPLKPLASQYRDFVALERAALASEAHQQYWHEQLADHTLLKLGRWPLAPEETAVSGAIKHSVKLPNDIYQGLTQLARSLAIPIKTILLATHMRVMSLLSGQSDVLTCLLASGRPEITDGDRVLGLFINSVPFRLKLTGGTWADLLMATFAAERDTMSYRRFPMAELQRRNNGHPLSETLFYFTHYHNLQALEDVLGLEVFDVFDHEVTSFAYTTSFAVFPDGSEIGLNLHYDQTQFSRAHIERVEQYFINTFTAMIADPLAHYESYHLLPESEATQLLVTWNETQVALPTEATIPNSFEAQVERTPHAIALVVDEIQLSYQALNEQANQLAHYLRTYGVGPEVVVAIYMDRSVEMILAILGTLKAGGTYLPLDPTYPQQRSANMIADAQTAVLLTKARFMSEVPNNQLHTICIDSEWANICQASKETPMHMLNADNTAYIIYTSGSTGKPKGVMVSHQAPLNLLTALNQEIYGERAGSPLQVGLNAPLLFDASMQQLLLLLAGHTLHLIPDDIRTDGGALCTFIRQHKLAAFDCTPSQLKLLLAAGLLTEANPSLQYVIVGGEAINNNMWQALAQSDQTQFYNVYGPTECTVNATITPITDTTPHIGHPLANYQIYILDAHLNPAPIGVGGELYIGGAGLARGYVNRAHTTAARFIPSPFSNNPGQRLYKTGDLARYLPNGRIEYLGRVDHQVKVRGYRIELGEIEAILAQHPQIRETAVMVQPVGNDDQLVAYFTRNNSDTLTTTEIRAFLQQQLPNYMLPAIYMPLEAMPLTTNGKLNRGALPQPTWVRPNLQEAFVPPRNDTEVTLAQIWCEVLRLERVGIHDNFFDLGGHSLLATQLASRIRKAFNVDMSVRQLFDNQTIAELSIAISQAQLGEILDESALAAILAEAASLPTNESKNRQEE